MNEIDQLRSNPHSPYYDGAHVAMVWIGIIILFILPWGVGLGFVLSRLFK